MPRVNRASLVRIRGIVNHQQEQMKQPDGSNQCGAYALLAALAAHGLPPEPVTVRFDLADDDGEPRTLSASVDPSTETFPTMAQAIYGATGILAPGGADAVSHNELVEEDGYNSPAAMGVIAKALGRPSVRVLVTEEGFQQLSAMYPGEEGRCRALLGEDAVLIGDEERPVEYEDPTEAMTHLVCTRPGNSLHWLARGSDGKYYDPADGGLAKDLPSPSELDEFTGLWIELS